MVQKIRTLLVDDHEMILDSLKLLFNLIEEIEVVDTVSDSRKVMDILADIPVDVLVVDYQMPYLDGLQLVHLVKEKYPDIHILILSVNEDSTDIQNAYHAGASGYILKKANRHELEKAIKTVAEGKKYFGANAMEAIFSNPNKEESFNDLKERAATLTKRELEIVKLLADELSSTEISSLLFISIGTVETHRHNILRKLEQKTTIGVIKFALKAGIV